MIEAGIALAAPSSRPRFDIGAISVVMQHELWDGNIQDHSDQGVVILIVGSIEGKETTLLRFNCFDIEMTWLITSIRRLSTSKPKR